MMLRKWTVKGGTEYNPSPRMKARGRSRVAGGLNRAMQGSIRAEATWDDLNSIHLHQYWKHEYELTFKSPFIGHRDYMRSVDPSPPSMLGRYQPLQLG